MSEDTVKVEYPSVNLEINFHESGAWFNTYVSITDYWKALQTGMVDNRVFFEAKVKEWVPEEEEFKYCYMAYNPEMRSWRIGYDS